MIKLISSIVAVCVLVPIGVSRAAELSPLNQATLAAFVQREAPKPRTPNALFSNFQHVGPSTWRVTWLIFDPGASKQRLVAEDVDIAITRPAGDGAVENPLGAQITQYRWVGDLDE